MTTNLRDLKRGDTFRFASHYDEYQVTWINAVFIRFRCKLTLVIHERLLKESGEILTIKY